MRSTNLRITGRRSAIHYQPFDTGPKSGTAEVYIHEMPGGQYTNLREQAESMGLDCAGGRSRGPMPRSTWLFGDIVKVTPSSKVVGDLTIFLVSHGTTVDDLLRLGPDHHLTLPNSVVEMVSGSLGEPPGGWPERIIEVVLKGRRPTPGRPGEHLPEVDLQKTKSDVESQLGHPVSHTDVMSHLMYPQVFAAYDRARQQYSDVSVLPTPLFFYGMERGEEASIEIEPGKRLMVKFLTVGEPHPDGQRTVFFELNGQPREVTVADRSLKAEKEERRKANPQVPGEVGAPIPGAVTNVVVELGDTVAKGERLLVMEAMKMQTTVYAPVGGKIVERFVSVGETVDAKDLLLRIE